MFNFFRRRKRKSEPEKISPAQGPGSSKDKNTSDPNPTACLDAPQQPLEVFGLYFDPEGYLVPAKPRLVGDEILSRYTSFTIDRDVVPQLVGLAPGTRCEIGAAALEEFYARAH